MIKHFESTKNFDTAPFARYNGDITQESCQPCQDQEAVAVKQDLLVIKSAAEGRIILYQVILNLLALINSLFQI